MTVKRARKPRAVTRAERLEALTSVPGLPALLYRATGEFAGCRFGEPVPGYGLTVQTAGTDAPHHYAVGDDWCTCPASGFGAACHHRKTLAALGGEAAITNTNTGAQE